KYGSSTSNQRIEAWWSYLRKYKSQFWIELFTKIEEASEWYYSNSVDYECLIYIFMPLLKVEISEFKQEWNSYKIRFNNNSKCPAGCPDDNYFLPELNNTQNYGFK
ncbi:2633_t:CDS:2, partial [Scutellospora calospora]